MDILRTFLFGAIIVSLVGGFTYAIVSANKHDNVVNQWKQACRDQGGYIVDTRDASVITYQCVKDGRLLSL